MPCGQLHYAARLNLGVRLQEEIQVNSISVTVAGIICVLVVVFIANQKKQARPVGEMPEPSPEVYELVRSGQRNAAIRLYRKETPSTLLEASRVVEHYRNNS